MNYEQFDKQVRDAAMQRAFPVEQATPDRLRQLLEQLSGPAKPAERSSEERAG
ncbi:hypothetical protein [Limimaricola hongkongensis]|uniref:Uncharacterized protein n=1 Tax=Limimaricola hongkongensis DSM 17492 TaxID=1122180 RepID=A0A017HHC8_9RHOB|nr:hypothetical protein [Limimaricola hongkongensis]EYD73756.1 hypothetical protein Lokhon_00312 [Limimaricola hongkongensis DSM 17492]